MLYVAAVAAFLVFALMGMQPATAHMIELEPSSEECFFEDLNPGDQVRRMAGHEKSVCSMGRHADEHFFLPLSLPFTPIDDPHLPSRRWWAPGH